MQAVRRAKNKPAGPRLRSPDAPPPESPAQKKPETQGPPTPPSRAAHTIVPVKHDIVCYECGYSHVITGHIHNRFCPKCKTALNMDDYTIDKPWSGTLRTIGVVQVTAGGEVLDGRIVARDLVLAGKALNGTIRVYGNLELCTGALLNAKNIDFKSVSVKQANEVVLDNDFKCQDINIAGSLRARIYSTGVVTIRAGGCLRGEVHGHHLVVEEGGGIIAKVFMEEEKPAAKQTEDAAQTKGRKRA